MRKEYMERRLQAGGVSVEAGNMEGDNVPARAPGDGGQDDGAR